MLAEMRAAIVFQGVSLLIGVLSVPVFLLYLGTADFLLWMIFTTIGGLMLQIEASLQMVSVRRIAREVAAANPCAARRELLRAETLYRSLSLCVVLLIIPGGFLFIANQHIHDFGQYWHAAWLLFGCAYAFNFLFGPNNCVMLATNGTDAFNYVNALTRMLNFVGALALLSVGFGVFGAVVSFSLSVLLGCAAIRWQARRRMPRSVSTAGPSALASVGVAPDDDRQRTDVVRLSLFTLVAYGLYRGGLLVATPFFSSAEMSSYGLTLAALSVVAAIAVIPNQIRLGALVSAVVGERQGDVQAQIAFGLMFATAVFLGSFGALVLVGPLLLGFLGSEVSFPSAPQAAMVFGAFLVESWIMVLVNVLIIRKLYGFVVWYCTTAAIAFAVGMSTAVSTGALYVGLALVPAIFQAIFALPAVFYACAKSSGRGWQHFALDIVGHSAQIIRARFG